MADNWLATAGSWVVAPAKVILAPWWDRLVDQKAEQLALRLKLLDAVVRFRVRDYQRSQSLDPDRAVGIASRIIERLKPIVKTDSSLDVEGGAFLQTVEHEVLFNSVQLSTWMELACLAAIRAFDPRRAIMLHFTDEKGSQSHASTVIYSLQSKLPFVETLCLENHTNGRLSPTAVDLLKEYCIRTPLPEAQYQIVDAVSPTDWTARLTDPKTLPRGWKPD
jgi:hypothetical protein